MANQQIIKKIALDTLSLESNSISELSKVIDSNFCEIIDTLKACNGKIVLTGIGKSAIISIFLILLTEISKQRLAGDRSEKPRPVAAKTWLQT